MALNILLRPATWADVDVLAAIEQESFPDPSWTATDFLRYDCVVAESGSAIAGFLVSRQNDPGTVDTPPEREILNLAVTASFRRSGVATLLLVNELKRGANVFLEVRETNVPALHLYKNAGFTEVGRRLNYYRNPVESAIVMRVKW